MSQAIAHSNARTWRWIVWLIVPAMILHELTHAAIARRWADVEIDWHAPVVIMHWNDAPRLAVVAAHLAPLAVGYSLGVLGAAAALGGFWPDLSLLAWTWLLGNWLNYTALSVEDLSILR